MSKRSSKSVRTEATAISPILNSPYAEPERHYATDLAGGLNYDDIRPGRRIFASDIPQAPLGQGLQPGMFEINEQVERYAAELVNLVRREVREWRKSGYLGVTSRVTRDLLMFWFADDERQDWHRLFFAQQEAVETAIWLNEIAEKSNPGNNILQRLKDAQAAAGSATADRLPRTAFKMATGTGKTVVMACLLLYHYFNRQEHRADPRYADYFLLVAPGITIKDRLGVLFVDTQAGNPVEARDYYRMRRLVPRQYEPLLDGLNARVVITNYHSFESRTLTGNKRSPFDGKRGDDGRKTAALEDFAQVAKRVMGAFKPGRRLLVLNDEAHHCYLPKAKGRTSDEDNSADENERAAVWFSGLRELAARFQLRAVYDLSATPYYLSGSGHPAYSLFPWVVSDFGLIDAIESGLVKIPFLPVSDDSQALDEPVLKNLYEHAKAQGLPKKGQKTQRKEDKAKGRQPTEAPPNLPPIVQSALHQFYKHYEHYLRGQREQGEKTGDLLTEPPVFIIVCNNTTVSKEVYKAIAGYEYDETFEETDSEGTTVERTQRISVPGALDLFSNYDRNTRRALRKPPTLLIDSDALENSGQVNDEFKKVFASEIGEFRRDYRQRHPDRSVDDITDAEILREVVNTVGKRGALGSHIRCVVSVSMLTEGWDANTVTHIMGLRAFGSQLLCEQVAGRALRRRSYFLDKKTGLFPPEYAHIIGVPFNFFRPGDNPPPPDPQPITQIRALPEREADYAITFPKLIGYRLETEEGEIKADFSGMHRFEVDYTHNPSESTLKTAFGPEEQLLSLDDVLDMRDQEIIWWATQALLRWHYRDDAGRPYVQKFAQLKRVVEHWYETQIKLIGQVQPKYKRILRFYGDKRVADHIQRGIEAGSQAANQLQVLPVFNHYNKFGSTVHVWGQTSKPVYPTHKSHVNYVVADTDSWEQIAAKTLEDMNGKDGPTVLAYVKNAFLGFEIPYEKDGKEHRYQPDFIARVKLANGEVINLIVEITGMNQDKAEKRWFVEHRWLPAVNLVRTEHGMDEWRFIDIANDIRTIRNQLIESLNALAT